MRDEQLAISFPGPTSGLERQHGEAGRRVVEAYHALLASLRVAPGRDEPLNILLDTHEGILAEGVPVETCFMTGRDYERLSDDPPQKVLE
jgi:hypothetical protein